jgi:pimeloyl-ACP methyl ester carboxylesterase
VGGAADPAGERLRPALEGLAHVLPGLRGSVMLERAGHSLPEEAPAELARELLAFLGGLTPPA